MREKTFGIIHVILFYVPLEVYGNMEGPIFVFSVLASKKSGESPYNLLNGTERIRAPSKRVGLRPWLELHFPFTEVLDG